MCVETCVHWVASDPIQTCLWCYALVGILASPIKGPKAKLGLRGHNYNPQQSLLFPVDPTIVSLLYLVVYVRSVLGTEYSRLTAP